MLASVSVLGRAELGSFGVIICVGIEMFIVNFTVQFACLCDNDVCLSNAGVVVSGFDEQILRHILSFVPGSSELAPKYSLQPETGHYLVKAGWPVVLKKMCHWKEADTTICICSCADDFFDALAQINL